MTKIKGICKNIDECSLAEDKVVQLAEKSEFICSECHQPLSPVEDDKKNKGGGPNKKLLLLIIAAVAVIIIVICAILFTGGQNKTPKQNGKAVDSTIVDSVKSSVTTNVEDSSLNNKAAKTEKEDQKTDDNIGNNVTPPTSSQKTKIVTVTKVIREKSEQSTNNSKGSLHLSYGSYKGDVKNGYPNGMGRLTYSHSRQINRYDNKGRTASVGDYIIGEFVNGFFVQGKHFDSDGNLIETLMIGVPAGNSYESK